MVCRYVKSCPAPQKIHVTCHLPDFFSCSILIKLQTAQEHVYLAVLGILVMALHRHLPNNVHKKVFIPVVGHKSFPHQSFSPDDNKIQCLGVAPSSCSRHVVGFLEYYHGSSYKLESRSEWIISGYVPAYKQGREHPVNLTKEEGKAHR